MKYTKLGKSDLTVSRSCMKRILSVLFALTLLVSCLSTAFAEEAGSAAEAAESSSHILVVCFSATG